MAQAASECTCKGGILNYLKSGTVQQRSGFVPDLTAKKTVVNEPSDHCQYQPLLVNDPILRQPILHWQQNLLNSLDSAFKAGNTEIAVELNQLALIEAYQGNDSAALNLCQLQIKYWQNIAARQGDRYLINCIQPWINTFRLQRWKQDKQAALFSYQQLAPDLQKNRNSLNSDFGVQLSLAELLTLNPDSGWRNMLETIYWSEFSQLLANNGDKAHFARHVQDGLASPVRFSVKMRLLELWFKVLIENKEFSYALSALHRMKLTSGPYQLVFRLLEMVLLFNLQWSDTQRLAEQLCQELMSKPADYTDIRHLYFVAAAFGIFRQLDNKGAKLRLCRYLLDQANQLNDEVLAVEAKLELVSEGQLDYSQVASQYKDSAYSLVRRKLGLAELNRTKRSAKIIHCVTAISELKFELIQYPAD